MSIKTSSSVKITTNLQTGQTQSFKNTYKTSTPTNIGKGGLSGIGRLGMIAITILAVGVGSSLYDFTITDLQEVAPNYQVNNDFIPIDDPLNNVNYIQYGENVVANTLAFIQPLSEFGQFVSNAWTDLLRFWGADTQVQSGSFIDTYGVERMTELYDIYNNAPAELGKSVQVYLALTSSERTFLSSVNIGLFSRSEQIVFLSEVWYLVYFDFYDLFGGTQWFWTMPNVVTLTQEL